MNKNRNPWYSVDVPAVVTVTVGDAKSPAQARAKVHELIQERGCEIFRGQVGPYLVQVDAYTEDYLEYKDSLNEWQIIEY